MIEEAKAQKKDPDDLRDACVVRYRKLLAIMAVAMEMPIYYSRYYPELIYLSWFFGFPSFDREQDPDRLARIPKQHPNVADIMGQGTLWKREQLVTNDFQPGDDAFEALKEEIRGNVRKTLAKV